MDNLTLSAIIKNNIGLKNLEESGGGSGEVWEDITENFDITAQAGTTPSQAIGLVPDDAFIRIHYTQVETDYLTRGMLISPAFKCLDNNILSIPIPAYGTTGYIAIERSNTSYTIEITIDALPPVDKPAITKIERLIEND